MPVSFLSLPSKSMRSVSRFTIIVNISRISGRSRILSEGGTTRYSETGRSWFTRSLNGEIAGGSVPRNQRIAVQRQRGLCSRKHTGEILVFLVEHLPNLLPHDRVRRGWSPSAVCHRWWIRDRVESSPVQSRCRGKLEPGRVKTAARSARQALALRRCCVANMQDHPGCDRCGGILPVAFLGAIFAGAHDHVRDVLRIRNVARGADADFGKRVEAGAVSSSTGENLKQRCPRLAEAGSFRPILTLDVVDHGRFRPCEERRDYQTDALAAAGGREGQNMLRSVMPEVVKPPRSVVVPAAHIHALLRVKQAGGLDISGVAQRAEP